jgi:hypothetical protein
MKIGFRIPSITKRIAARTSIKRVVPHNLGLKAPRGLGWVLIQKRRCITGFIHAQLEDV